MGPKRVIAVVQVAIGFAVASAVYLVLPPMHALLIVLTIAAAAVCGYMISAEGRPPHR